MTIREIYKIFAEIDEELEENGGELTDNIQERLAINANDFEEKVNNICYLIDHAGGVNAVLKKQADKLKKAMDRNDQTVTLLKAMIANGVKRYGKVNKTGNRYVKTGEYSITVIPYEALEITDQLALPSKYLYGSLVTSLNKELCEMIKTEHDVSFSYDVDKKALNSDLKEGIEIEGAELIIKEKLSLR